MKSGYRIHFKIREQLQSTDIQALPRLVYWLPIRNISLGRTLNLASIMHLESNTWIPSEDGEMDH